MASEVGSGQVAIVPTFKGFRKAVNSETDAAAKEADSGFRRAFSRTGTESGSTTGRGFKQAFESTSSGFADKAVKDLERAVARAAQAYSAARLKEQDAAGKLRVAEAQLYEARRKYSSDSSQVIRAEERLASAARGLVEAQDRTKRSTDDLRQAQSNLANQAVETGETMNRAGATAAQRFFGGFSTVLGGSFAGTLLANIVADIGNRIGYGIGSAIRSGFEFGVGSIKIASDLQESFNAVEVVYGEFGDRIIDIGKNSAREFGVSQRAVNSYAVQFSAFAKTIAGAGGDVSGVFRSILTRASDFASVMNVDVDEALRLFQSGLAGETEPLRRYGKDLSAATVEAYAYSHGIAQVGEELTESQKQQARYGALMEQTADVQGDFLNTADSLANRLRTQGALWDGLQAQIGEAFLPMAEAVTGVITDSLIPAIASLVDEHGPAIAEAFDDAIPSLVALAEQILPKLPGLFADIAEGLPGFIDAVADGIDAAIEFGHFVSDLNGFMDDFGAKLSTGQEQIYAFFDPLAERLGTGAEQWGGFFGAVSEGIDGFGGKLSTGQEQIYGFFGTLGERFATGGQQISTFFGGVGQGFDGMGGKLSLGGAQIGGFVGTVIGRFQEGGAQIGSFFGSFGQRLATGAGQIASFAGAVGAQVGVAVSWVAGLPGRAAAAIGDLSGMLVARGRSLIQGFINGIRDMIGGVGRAVSDVLSWARGFFPSSPAKRGPFAGAGWTKLRQSGGAVMEQWTSGMARPDLTGALSSIRLGLAPVAAPATVTAKGPAGQPVQFVYNGDFYSYDPHAVARQDREQLGRLLDAAFVGKG